MNVESADKDQIDMVSEQGYPETLDKLHADLLPDITDGNVSLSQVVDRLITFAYTEFLNLIETFPSKSNEQKKSLAIEYTLLMRQVFAKLIAISRWAKNADQINKAQRIVAYLQEQNIKIIEALDSLYGIGVEEARKRARNYDILSAIQVLKSGSHKCFESQVLDKYISRNLLSATEKQKIVKLIEEEVRLRLVKGEPLPKVMSKYTVKNATVNFVVPQEFRVSLTFLQVKKIVPWHIISLEIFVQGHSCDHSKVTFKLTQPQLNSLKFISQDILINANNQFNYPDDKDAGSIASNPPIKSQNDKIPPLAQLYDYLPLFLAQTKYNQHLSPEIDKLRTSLTINYWISPSSIASPSLKLNFPGNTLISVPRNRQMHLHQNSSASQGNFIKLTILESSKYKQVHFSKLNDTNQFPKDYLSLIPEGNPSLLSRVISVEKEKADTSTKYALRVEWSGTSGLRSRFTRVKNLFGDLEIESKLSPDNLMSLVPLHLDSLNAEALVSFFQKVHSALIIFDLYKSLDDSNALSPSDIQILLHDPVLNVTEIVNISKLSEDFLDFSLFAASGEPNSSTHADTIKMFVLRVWYRSRESAIDISINTVTGRLVLKPYVFPKNESVNKVDPEVLEKISKDLNQRPSRIFEAILELRSLLIMSDIEKSAYKISGAVPLLFRNGSSISKINNSFRIPIRISPTDNELILNCIYGKNDPGNLNTVILILQLDINEVHHQSERLEWFIFITMEKKLSFYLAQFSSNLENNNSFRTLVQIMPLSICDFLGVLCENTHQNMRNSHFSQTTSDSKRIPLATSSEQNFGFFNSLESYTLSILEGRSGIPEGFLDLLVDSCMAYIYTTSIQSQLLRSKLQYHFFPSNILSSSTDSLDEIGSLYRTRSKSPVLARRSSYLSLIPTHGSTGGPIPKKEKFPTIYLPISSILNKLGEFSRFFRCIFSRNTSSEMVRLKVRSVQSKSKTLLKRSSSSVDISMPGKPSRYYLKATIPLSKLNLPSLVKTRLLENSLYVAVTDANLGLSVHSDAYPSTIFINREYYALETCTKDFLDDWANIMAILNLVKLSSESDILWFSLGVQYNSNYNLSNSSFEQSGSSLYYKVCDYCSSLDTVGPSILLNLGVPGFYIMVHSSRDHGNKNLDGFESQIFGETPGPSNFFEISFLVARSSLLSSTCCNHKINACTIACTNCFFNQQCDQCLLGQNSNFFNPPFNSSSWQLIRFYIESVKKFLNSSATLPALNASFQYLLVLISNFNGLNRIANYSQEHQNTSFQSKFLDFLPVSNNSKIYNGLPDGSNDIFVFDQKVQQIFLGSSPNSMSLLPNVDSSVNLIFNLYDEIKVSLYGSKHFLISSAQFLGSSRFFEMPPSDGNNSDGLAPFELTVLCIKSLLAFFSNEDLLKDIANCATPENFSDSNSCIENKETIEKTLYSLLNGFTTFSSIIDEVSQSTFQIPDDKAQLPKIIPLNKDIVILSFGLFPVFLRIFCEISSITTLCSNLLSSFSKNFLKADAQRCKLVKTVKNKNPFSFSILGLSQNLQLTLKPILKGKNGFSNDSKTRGIIELIKDIRHCETLKWESFVCQLLNVEWIISIKSNLDFGNDSSQENKLRKSSDVKIDPLTLLSFETLLNSFIHNEKHNISTLVLYAANFYSSLLLLPNSLFHLLLGYFVKSKTLEISLEKFIPVFDGYQYFLSHGIAHSSESQSSSRKTRIKLAPLVSEVEFSSEIKLFDYDVSSNALSILAVIMDPTHTLSQSLDKLPQNLLFFPLKFYFGNKWDIKINSEISYRLKSAIENYQNKTTLTYRIGTKDTHNPEMCSNIALFPANLGSDGKGLITILENVKSKAIDLLKSSKAVDQGFDSLGKLAKPLSVEYNQTVEDAGILLSTSICLLSGYSYNDFLPHFST
ncbi:hypothetical protein BB560_000044 [Smittium megazygosporum]|uniref:Mediator of RNA polymerase II transcription subunit 14 n=1 Tax=Smittium megazygosporum TaxID=133381 RepID=A0A2T9ZAR1_9FUNG|nr:hypothetical protein BB560_003905 [Smittium megazygosporum]PVV05436.1 hypothetical protein BB560_000044 [Smittium megazygosporum]